MPLYHFSLHEHLWATKYDPQYYSTDHKTTTNASAERSPTVPEAKGPSGAAHAALAPLESGEINLRTPREALPGPPRSCVPLSALCPAPHLPPRRPRALRAEAKRSASAQLLLASLSPRLGPRAALPSGGHYGESTAGAPTRRPRGCDSPLSAAAAVSPGAGAPGTSRGDP